MSCWLMFIAWVVAIVFLIQAPWFLDDMRWFRD
jgi:hypothetical protein